MVKVELVGADLRSELLPAAENILHGASSATVIAAGEVKTVLARGPVTSTRLIARYAASVLRHAKISFTIFVGCSAKFFFVIGAAAFIHILHAVKLDLLSVYVIN